MQDKNIWHGRFNMYRAFSSTEEMLAQRIFHSKNNILLCKLVTVQSQFLFIFPNKIKYYLS